MVFKVLHSPIHGSWLFDRTCLHSLTKCTCMHTSVLWFRGNTLQLGYLEVTVQEKLRSGWPGPFVKVEERCD
jgi:hypothetical protein